MREGTNASGVAGACREWLLEKNLQRLKSDGIQLVAFFIDLDNGCRNRCRKHSYDIGRSVSACDGTVWSIFATWEQRFAAKWFSNREASHGELSWTDCFGTFNARCYVDYVDYRHVLPILSFPFCLCIEAAKTLESFYKENLWHYCTGCLVQDHFGEEKGLGFVQSMQDRGCIYQLWNTVSWH